MGLIPPLSLAYLARRAPVEKKRFEGEMIDVGRCCSRGVLGDEEFGAFLLAYIARWGHVGFLEKENG